MKILSSDCIKNEQYVFYQLKSVFQAMYLNNIILIQKILVKSGQCLFLCENQ